MTPPDTRKKEETRSWPRRNESMSRRRVHRFGIIAATLRHPSPDPTTPLVHRRRDRRTYRQSPRTNGGRALLHDRSVDPLNQRRDGTASGLPQGNDGGSRSWYTCHSGGIAYSPIQNTHGCGLTFSHGETPSSRTARSVSPRPIARN